MMMMSLQFDATRFVVARQADAPIDEDAAVAALDAVIRGFAGGPDEHSVPWSATRWLDARVWHAAERERLEVLVSRLPSAGDRGQRSISRADVFRAVEEGDLLDAFFATMAWGFGKNGYGWRRTTDILREAHRVGPGRLPEALKVLRAAGGDPSTVYRAWSQDGEANLAGLGTAFASKLAYFLAYDRRAPSPSGPLIADLNTAWALWALAGIWDSRASATRYAAYVGWAERNAERLGCRSDAIERALFVMGPEIRREWNRRDTSPTP